MTFSTPGEALAAAEDYVNAMPVGEHVETVHFDRRYPGGDHSCPAYWTVELRTRRVVVLGSAWPYRNHGKDGSLREIRGAYAADVARYSSIDGKDWLTERTARCL